VPASIKRVDIVQNQVELQPWKKTTTNGINTNNTIGNSDCPGARSNAAHT